MALSFGILSVNPYEQLNYEKQAIYDNAVKHFKKVLLIDPRQICYQFIRGKEKPIINYKGKNISNLSAIHIRGFSKMPTATSILAHSLDLCGCILSDPPYKFKAGFNSKMLMTIGQFEDDTGSSSFIAFDRESTLRLISTITNKKLFPMIAKPINGRQGEGIFLLETEKEMMDYTDKFFKERDGPDFPIFFQTYMNFVKEYRVFVIDKSIIGIVSKTKKKGSIMANAAKGAVFIQAHNQEIVEFVLDNVSDGIYGIDVAIDDSGNIHLIETNGSPNWKSFEATTGINVAEVIVEDTLRKVLEKEQEEGY